MATIIAVIVLVMAFSVDAFTIGSTGNVLQSYVPTLKSTTTTTSTTTSIRTGAGQQQQQQQQQQQSLLLLFMAPRYDPSTETWMATKPEEESQYGPTGSLMRQGPVPFFKRLVNEEEYDQLVLKYMASEGVDRTEAQGNMDAYFANAQDWAFQKMEEKKGAPKFDYGRANQDPKQLVLSLVWASIVSTFLLRFGYVLIFENGDFSNGGF